MKAAVSIDLVSEILVIGDENPVFMKSFRDDCVVVHSSGLVEHGKNIMVMIP
jgi:hypothetical protein